MKDVWASFAAVINSVVKDQEYVKKIEEENEWLHEQVKFRDELMELTLKSARRCAHDLAHAAETELLHERARHWIKLFYPENGRKDYRTELHNELDLMDLEICRLKRLLKENGVDFSREDARPF